MLQLVFFLLLISGLLEIKKMLKEKNCREIAAFSLLAVISLLYSIEIHFKTSFLPNPNRIFFLVKPVGDAFMKMLGMS